jgi:hypothetical protein
MRLLLPRNMLRDTKLERDEFKFEHILNS